MERIKALGASVYSKLKSEPVLVMYGILLSVNALALFGYDVDPELLVKADAFLVPLFAFLTRKEVTPISKLEPMTPFEFIEEFGEGA